MLTRREAAQAFIAAAATAALGAPALAADKVVKIGMDLSLTGADSESADQGQERHHDGDRRRQRGRRAFRATSSRPLVLDDGTATAGQYDPAQAATNARKMVSDKEVVAALGPQMSGAGKAMAPILSQGDLATITPSSTNPDITDPKFAEQYPSGRQADLLPHRDDRRLPGPEHGELLRRGAEGEVGLHPGRQRCLRRGHGRCVREAGGEEGHQGRSAATGWTRRRPTTRRSSPRSSRSTRTRSTMAASARPA